MSYLFCNIHPEMSAAIIAVDSRWYGVSDARGRVVIPGVPDGKYEVHAWHENATPEALKAAERIIEIGDNRALPIIALAVQPASSTHKNKYGKDYDPDTLKPDY